MLNAGGVPEKAGAGRQKADPGIQSLCSLRSPAVEESDSMFLPYFAILESSALRGGPTPSSAVVVPVDCPGACVSPLQCSLMCVGKSALELGRGSSQPTRGDLSRSPSARNSHVGPITGSHHSEKAGVRGVTSAGCPQGPARLLQRVRSTHGKRHWVARDHSCACGPSITLRKHS